MSRPRQGMLLAVVAGTGITVCGCAAAPTPQMNPAGAAPATTTVGVASATTPPIGPTPGAQTPAPVGASGFPMPPPGTCHTGTFNGQPLPDPVCSPGSTNPAVTQANIHDTICRAGWTATVRPPVTVTDKIKAASARAYGLGADARGELDHEIPLELGGDPGSLTDVANLWFEVGPIPNPKDGTENTLNHATCHGLISLVTAQSTIAHRWPTAVEDAGLIVVGTKVCLRADPGHCVAR